MPRSFLVKKVKLDDFSSADLESSYGRSRADLSLRFHEKGYISDYMTPAPYDGESDNGIKVPSPGPIYSDYGAPDSDQPDSPQSEISSGYINGDNAVSEGYTVDAFFITDGRSRRKVISSPRSLQRHTCNECGKTYATSSNLSRHKQTFPDSRIFKAENSKIKKEWLEILEETKKNKVAKDKHIKEEEVPTSPVRQEVTTNPFDEDEPLGSEELVDLSPEWIQELPEDLDVCIAQRDFAQFLPQPRWFREALVLCLRVRWSNQKRSM